MARHNKSSLSSRSLLSLVAMCLLLLPSCARILETPLAWKMGPATKVPEGYETYAFFLNTSSEYPDEFVDKKLKALDRNFKSFGDSIGDKNLAVWVNEPGSEQLSVSRGKYYADLFSRWTGASLEYSNGPYVIITDTHPDVLKTLDCSAPMESPPVVISISFNNIADNRIVEALNFLEARIRRNELGPRNIGLHALWLKLKSWWDDEDNTAILKDITIALLSR